MLLQGNSKRMEKRRDWGQAGGTEDARAQAQSPSEHLQGAAALLRPAATSMLSSGSCCCVCPGFSLSFGYLLEMFKHKQNLQDAAEVTGVTEVRFENRLGVRSTYR